MTTRDQGSSACTLTVRVTPGARADEVRGVRDGVVLARVKAPPEAGRANVALCRLLGKRLGVPASRVAVLRGLSSRQKTVRIEGVDADAAIRTLAEP